MNKFNWNKEIVENAVKNNYCYTDVLRELNIPIAGNNTKTLKNCIEKYRIDISHFTFTAKTKGDKQYKAVSDYLINESSIKTFKLKQKLLKEGLKTNKCEICGITEWQGQPLVMQLHHINGNPTDNRLENLQMLCPNCHSQTDNFCGSANKTEKPKYHCTECGRKIKTNVQYCSSCAAKHRRKYDWDKEINNIKKFLQEGQTHTQIGKHYSVSETTIRKIRKKYNI